MPTTVLFVAGTGRSGSTLLARILGEADGLFNAGEIRYLWERGLREGRLCGCGEPLGKCPVWGRVLDELKQNSASRPEVMMGLLRHSTRLRSVPALMAGRLVPRLDPARSASSNAARISLAELYSRIAEVSGCEVIVDSSKLPAFAHLLQATPEIDLRVVHLVRDPRAAAFSWSSRKALDDGATRSHMEQIGAAKSSLLWDVWNSAAAILLNAGKDRYLRLRYEDFVAEPAAAVQRVLALVGKEKSALPFADATHVRLGPSHSVAGNPDRMRTGLVEIRADERWRSSMPAAERAGVSMLTAPLLVRYGYSLRGRSGLPTAATAETVFDRAAASENVMQRSVRRIRRHLRWGRTEGVWRLIEEDDLNPLSRGRVAMAKWRWRSAHPQPRGSAMPVYLVGVQRSGTNMLARGFDTAPEFEVRNENDRAAFDKFRLRSPDVVRDLVMRSGHRYVLFKPLCDSQRVDELLDGIDTPVHGRAIWAYRDVDGRARSAVSKFGRNNLLVLSDIAGGRGGPMWQAERLSPATLQTLRSFDYSEMSPHSAAALFWWMRNTLYFELGFDRRPDVLLASYQELLADPAPTMRRICRFLGFEYRDSLVAHIAPRASHGNVELAIDPKVRALCAQLQSELDAALLQQRDAVAA